MWIAAWLWSQWKGNWPHLNLILGIPSNFAFLGWHQCSSPLVTVLLGTLWSSVEQIEAPYVLDWENAISLDIMQGNRSSSCKEGNFSFSLSWRQIPCISHHLQDLWHVVPYSGDITETMLWIHVIIFNIKHMLLRQYTNIYVITTSVCVSVGSHTL